ncbi:MAG: SH3 domain-containing protein [Parvibaculaceae bacterium]
MVKSAARGRRIGSAILGSACIAVAVATAWSLMAGQSRVSGASAQVASEITGSTSAVDKLVGPSGLPLPRFVSLKADKINVRRGPSSDHQVAWVYQRKGLPVEITAEFENWRRIRDSDGEEGWVYQSMLSGKRMALVAPWRKREAVPMYASPDASSGLVALVKAGVVASLEDCTGDWCQVSASGYEGWIAQPMIWGAYPGERVEE